MRHRVAVIFLLALLPLCGFALPHDWLWRAREWSHYAVGAYLVSIFLLHVVWVFAPAVRLAYREHSGHCPGCGYDLRGSPDGCSECGRGRPKRA